MTTTYTYSQQPRTSTAYETSIVGQQPRLETSQTLGRSYYTTSSAVPRSVGYTTYQTAPGTRVVSEGAPREVILNRSIQGAPTTYRTTSTSLPLHQLERSVTGTRIASEVDGSSTYRVIHDPLTSHRSTIVEQPIQRTYTVEAPIERTYTTQQPIERRYTTQQAPVSTRTYYTTQQAYQPPRGIHRPFLGFGMRTNAQLKHSGLQCDLVWDQGPAQAAGIQLEDEIIAIGDSGERLTSLKQAQHIIEREAQVGGTIRVVGRRAGSGELYETPVRIMSRDPGAGAGYFFNAEGKSKETLDRPLSRKNSLYNPNATRHDDVLSANRVRPSTNATASEAALGSARNSARLSGRLSSAAF